jgi:2',3'-cyclic-nucleotide 2'-phosphodiesterase/3'-nucleotidase
MKNSIVILGLFLIILSSCQQMHKEENVKIAILETTDVHGSFFPYDLVNKTDANGSLAQVYTYVQQLRHQDSLSVVLLDNGDILQGTPVVYYANYVDKSKVHPLAEMMNFMGYDAQTIGNHDIEAGHPVYDKYRNGIKFPLLAANAIDSNTNRPYFSPYYIIERQGVKIVVLGLITPSIPNWLPENLWSGMYFEDMVESARYWVKTIKDVEKPDLLIGLFHSGLDASYGGANPLLRFNENASLLVAKEVPGFDAVFSGHDHRKQAFTIKDIDSNDVVILNGGSHAHNIAQVEFNMHWNKDKKAYEKTATASLIDTKDYEPDSNFMAKFSPWFNAAKEYTSENITTMADTLFAKNALNGPSEFVDMIHKAQLEISGDEISFAAPFSINAIIPQGNFTRADLFNLYRFENFLCTVILKGYEVKTYLEYSTDLWFDTTLNAQGNYLLLKNEEPSSFSRVNLKNPYYNFDSAAGIKYEIDPTAERGHRVRIISMADGSEFDPQKAYKVVMNSYRANGGGGFLTEGLGIDKLAVKRRIISTSKEDFRDLLGEWLKKQNTPFKAEKLNSWSINTY